MVRWRYQPLNTLRSWWAVFQLINLLILDGPRPIMAYYCYCYNHQQVDQSYYHYHYHCQHV